MAGESVRSEVGFIAPIEGLRGIAVLWVIAFHYGALRPADDAWIALLAASLPVEVLVRNGYLGVDLFFLITGFLLTLPWYRHAEESRAAPAALEFYRRRALRILPAYYVQLLLLFFVFLPLLQGWTLWKTDPAFTLDNFGAHLFLLHYTTPYTSASLGINGALWTLSLEAQYYLLLPLLAPLIVRAPLRTAGALAAAAIAWRWLALHDLGPLVDAEAAIGARWQVSEATIRHLVGTQLPAYLAHFAAGILAGRAWMKWRADPVDRTIGLAWLALALLALALLYRIHAPGGAFLGEFTWFLIPVCLGAAMLALVSRGLPVSRILLANPPLAFVGRISYSVYLYHLPLLLLWNRFAAPLGWLSLPAFLALTLLVGWLSYHFVERPFLQR
jgi:peptidoglycan/LPS O-acetylase OafA/YrhL